MRIFSLFTILSILLLGCSPNTISETSAIVWITGGVSQDSHLFEVKDDGRIKVTSGSVILDTETKETFYGEDTKTKLVTPNANDTSTIKTLLSKIGAKEGDMINPGNDAVEIFALVNSKLYWTSFYDVSNDNLSELVNVLIKSTDTHVGDS